MAKVKGSRIANDCRDELPDRFNDPNGPNNRAKPESYPFWMVIFSGVGAIVAGLLHAAFWKPFSIIFGAIVSFKRLYSYT